MSLYDRILNINGKNIENEIKNSIMETRQQLDGLEEDRMCLIYSSYLYQNLKKRHILAHIIDTNDLGFPFQHRFVLVYDKDYYLIDLTYSQFFNDDILFTKLLKEGYQKIDNKYLNYYLKNIVSKECDLNLDDVFIKK